MIADSGWINTYTGRKFYPLHPEPDQIVIEDIAHALSNTCRYTGHSRFFYSVAEHSCHVTNVSFWDTHSAYDRAYALAGLLHDGSEAYLCDLARPLKVQPEFAPYREAEARLQAMILQRFGLPPELPEVVEIADKRMLVTESRFVFGDRIHPDWNVRRFGEPYKIGIEGWTPDYAERRFLSMFYNYGGVA